MLGAEHRRPQLARSARPEGDRAGILAKRLYMIARISKLGQIVFPARRHEQGGKQ
jgi:hypothetical protein